MLKKLYLITFALIFITTAMNAQRGRIGDKLTDDTTKKIPPKELLPAPRHHDEINFLIGRTFGATDNHDLREELMGEKEQSYIYGVNIRRDGAGVSVLAHKPDGDPRMIAFFVEGYPSFGNNKISILAGVGMSHYKRVGEDDNNEFAYAIGLQCALSETLVVGYSYRKAHWNMHILKFGLIL
jgi:hypothetical protein